jgi:type VI secretion system protein ImpC
MADERSEKIGFEIRVGRQPGSSEPLPETPFRVALLGDFSGRASRGLAEVGNQLAERKPLRVDRDNLDDVLGRLAPELHLPIDTGLTLRFETLEDFHPDRLYGRVPLFESLRHTRQRLADPATSAETARALSGSQPESTEPGQAAAPRVTADNLLDQILDVTPGVAPDAEAVVGGDLREMVKRIVGPHLVDEIDPTASEMLAQIDVATAALMRALLHLTALQSLEARWRAVHMLTRRIDTGTQLQLYLVDISKDELLADQDPDRDLQQSGLYKLLVESGVGTHGGEPWAVIAGDFTFGPEPEDLLLLARLGAVANLAGAPWLSAADPRLAGFQSLHETPDPSEWSREDNPLWDALRREPQAASIGLALPRFLVRPPYGARTEPCDDIPFEEMETSGVPRHEDFLWANPAFACALLLARSFASAGWEMRPGRHQDLEGLPLYLFDDDGETIAQPCAEALLTERAAQRLLEHGLMPLASMKGDDSARLVRFQSIARPLAALTGPWSAREAP